MIDYFALALGHGLLAFAMLRLVMRAGVDEDPLITAINTETNDNRAANSPAARNAARQRRGAGDPESAPSEVAPRKPRSRTKAIARARRSRSEAIARK